MLDLILTELSVLQSAPVGADELRARKSILVGGYGRELATSSGLADVLGNAALYGLPTDELGLYVAKVEAVTPAEVQAFAARRLKPETVSVVVVGDAKVFGETLKAKVPNLEVIASDQLDLDSPTLRQKAK